MGDSGGDSTRSHRTVALYPRPTANTGEATFQNRFGYKIISAFHEGNTYGNTQPRTPPPKKNNARFEYGFNILLLLDRNC